MGGYIYLLYSYEDESYKIGFTKHKDIENNRLINLQTGNASEITVVSKYKSNNYKLLEKLLHLHYNPSNIRGEWFKLTIEQVHGFITQCEKFDKTASLLKENNHYFK